MKAYRQHAALKSSIGGGVGSSQACCHGSGAIASEFEGQSSMGVEAPRRHAVMGRMFAPLS